MQTLTNKQKLKNTDGLDTISSLIKLLCEESYTIHDVDAVVDCFFQKTKELLKYKQHLFNEWLETDNEICDVCYDFIAPLFARDRNGHFYRLNDYFHSKFDFPDDKFDVEITKILKSVINQESILIYACRDPFGKVFYDSLQYLLKKYPNWSKIKTSQQGVIIHGKPAGSIIDSEQLSKMYRQTKTENLTKSLDVCLSILVDQNNYSISVIDLLLIVRDSAIQIESAQVTHEDPSLQGSLDIISSGTLSYLDKSILNWYMSKGILNKEECSAFFNATKEILYDFSDGGIQQSYFEYLGKFLKQTITKEDYQKKYKTRFEYVVKTAKKEFSVNTKIEFNL